MVVVVSDSDGKATYSVTYDNELFVAASALGMKTNIGDFTTGLLMALKLNLNLSAFFNAGETVTLYSDDAKLNGTASEIKINKKQELKISIPKNGGLVITK